MWSVIGMTDEARREAAARCYAGLLARGRRSCAGCDLQYDCEMPAAMTRWLVTEFLPAIDPTGTVFGVPRIAEAA
jgi:hypothetical protein